MTLDAQIMEIAKNARAAAFQMATCDTSKKNETLLKIASKLEREKEILKAENGKDLLYAREKGLSEAMIDRLALKEATLLSMIEGLQYVATLPDPVGEITRTWSRPNGLQVSRMRIPLGVICMIYESRPNVTIDAAGLCLKSGNSVILRGGSESFHSNQALSRIISESLLEAGLPPHAAQIVPVRDREAVTILLQQEEWIDLIIPRGGESLIRFVVNHSRIPVLKHYKGVCHVYVDEGADIQMAIDISMNAKVQRPGVCNAMETLLVHRAVATQFLPRAANQLQNAGVELRGCEKTVAILPGVKQAVEQDWREEYLDLILAVKVVESMDEAIAHMAKYGSNHTESIVTSDYERARRFLRQVDSSVVLVNASTRFNDGGQLGLGAEIGISTSKLHAFGPMGLDELTTTKFVVMGDGQVRS